MLLAFLLSFGFPVVSSAPCLPAAVYSLSISRGTRACTGTGIGDVSLLCSAIIQVIITHYIQAEQSHSHPGHGVPLLN